MGLVDRIAAIVGLSPTGQVPGTNQDSMLYDRTQEYRLRIGRYRHNWAVYKGYTAYALMSEDGTRPTHVNYVRRNIDKINYFAFAHGCSLAHPRLQDYLLAADEQWGTSCVEKRLRMAQFGSVSGDVMVLVAPREISDTIVQFDEKTEDFSAETKTELKILILNPAYCTPVYSDVDMDELIAMHIKVPKREYSPGGVTTQYQNLYIDRKEVRIWVDNEKGKSIGEAKTVPNPLGEVYCIHIRNYPDGDNLFGADDVTEVEKLNTEVTDSITSIGQVIRYHGDPITCIFGAKASNLKKGPNKIWGNLPKDGRVENLQLEGNLEAANKHLSELKEDLHAIMGVPEIAQGTKQAISNTSGVSLHTMYLPLIERAEIKQKIYGPHYVRILTLALRWMSHLGTIYRRSDDGSKSADGRSKKLTEDDYSDILTNTTLEWGSPLPKDELVQTNLQVIRYDKGLQSQRGALVALGVKDPDATIKEIEADNKKKMKDAQTALQNNKPETSGLGPTGVEPGNGENVSDSGEQKGRPRGTTDPENS